MWWVWIVALALSYAVAAPAQAASDDATGARAVQKAAASVGKGRVAEEARHASVQLQLGGALAVVQPAVRAHAAPPEARRRLLFRDDARRGASAEAARSVAVLRGGGEGASGSVFSYPVSETVSLGLRYRFMTNEDMARFEAAESGSLESGYENHRFLVRALWQF